MMWSFFALLALSPIEPFCELRLESNDPEGVHATVTSSAGESVEVNAARIVLRLKDNCAHRARRLDAQSLVFERGEEEIFGRYERGDYEFSVQDDDGEWDRVTARNVSVVVVKREVDQR